MKKLPKLTAEQIKKRKTTTLLGPKLVQMYKSDNKDAKEKKSDSSEDSDRSTHVHDSGDGDPESECAGNTVCCEPGSQYLFNKCQVPVNDN